MSTLLARAVSLHRDGRSTDAAALYRRIPAGDPAYPDARHLLGLTEHAAGRHAEALVLVETAIGIRPSVATYHVARAVILTALDRPEEAAVAVEQALRSAPRDPEALNALAIARMRMGDSEAAVQACEDALAVRPAYAEAASNLGVALRALGRLGEAESALREAVRLRPGYGSALANLTLVLQDQARYEEALAISDRAVAAEPGNAVTHGNRAMLLLLMGRLEEGFAEYEWRWRMPGFATARRDFAGREWPGERLEDGRLLIHAEQGLGSAIQFVRYAALAADRCGAITLECQPPLERLFRQSLLQPAGPVTSLVIKGRDLGPFDAHVPMMSLPHRLGTTLATIPAAIPYLRSDPDDLARWRRRLDEMAPGGEAALRVGLVWAGNPRHENDANRSMPAHLLAPLLDTPGVRFFSLQVPADPDALRGLGPAVHDLAPELADFAETAAVLDTLDLVITVDTAAAHLAGALGRTAWVLLPCSPEWRWLCDREDSPWYPSLRLFRQTAAGDWAGVVARVALALSTLALSSMAATKRSGAG